MDNFSGFLRGDFINAIPDKSLHANRRRDLYIKYIYSMRPYPQDPKTAEFVLDAEEEGVNKSNVGDVYKTENPN